MFTVKKDIKIFRVEGGYLDAGGFDGKALRLDSIFDIHCMTKKRYLAMLSPGGIALKLFLFRFARLLLGLVLYAAGMVPTLNAHIGYGPWEVFHVGLAETAGMSIGSAAVVTGVVVALFAVLLGGNLGLWTGWWLGGMVGLGTVIAALAIGFCIQLSFRVLEFDPTRIRHESLRMSWQNMLRGRDTPPSS
jgi:hypothetical protein